LFVGHPPAFNSEIYGVDSSLDVIFLFNNQINGFKVRCFQENLGTSVMRYTKNDRKLTQGFLLGIMKLLLQAVKNANSAVSDGIKAIISPTNGPIAPRYGPTDKAILDMDLAKDLLSRSPDNPVPISSPALMLSFSDSLRVILSVSGYTGNRNIAMTSLKGQLYCP
jgi:hypothetical protein